MVVVFIFCFVSYRYVFYLYSAFVDIVCLFVVKDLLNGYLTFHGKTDKLQGVQRNQLEMHAACAQGDPPGIASGAVPAGALAVRKTAA